MVEAVLGGARAWCSGVIHRCELQSLAPAAGLATVPRERGGGGVTEGEKNTAQRPEADW